MKVVVSSNCQTGGIAASLMHLIEGATVVPAPAYAAGDPAAEEAFVSAHLLDADAWVTTTDPATALGRLRDRRAGEPALVRIPNLQFRAFHPDLVYVRSVSSGALTTHHYNSAIVAWCYKHAVAPGDTARLFTRGVYEKLGYFSAWSTSVEAMRAAFARTELDFGAFFLRARRERPFMHSVNHPTSRCLFTLARLVAMKLGARPETLSWDARLPDGLGGAYWPIYPEIAESYGLQGDYSWLVRGTRLVGVREYVGFMYKDYEAQGMAPAQIRIAGSERIYDDVLPQALKELA